MNLWSNILQYNSDKPKPFKPNNGVRTRWTKKREHEIEYIYVLHTDADPTPFYVGRTYDLETRLKAHVRETLGGGNTPKCAYIRAQIAAGHTILIKEVDRRPFGQLGDLEAQWIEDLGWQTPLMNSKGGDDPTTLSAQEQVVLRDAIQEHKKQLKERRKKQKVPYVPPTALRLLQNKWVNELIKANKDNQEWPNSMEEMPEWLTNNTHLTLPNRPYPIEEF